GGLDAGVHGALRRGEVAGVVPRRRRGGVPLLGGGDTDRPEQVWAAEVAGDLGEVLGSSPALGVLGLAAEDLVEVGADRAEELRVVIGQLPAGGVLDGRLAGDPGGQALTADDPLDGLVGTV